MRWHPDRVYTLTLIQIIERGVKIGHKGHAKILINPPHQSATLAPDVLANDIRKQLQHDRLTILSRRPDQRYIASPLGLVPKHTGGWRRIHDLSFPKGFSVNDYIPVEYGALEYAAFDDAVVAILLTGRGAVLIKKDLADAFRHIPVAESDHWLLGFVWEEVYYIDRFLPFGLRTAPFIFDLFAKALHWILIAMLRWSTVIHYLDDFLAILPPGSDSSPYSQQFNKVCSELGLAVNHAKDTAGTVAEFMGFEIDTVAMHARLPEAKLRKGIQMIDSALAKSSITRPILESIVGFLSFASKVILPGRAFLRRLYNTLTKAPHFIHLTPDAKADLRWWRTFLAEWNGIKILRQSTSRPNRYMWTDASGLCGVGGHIKFHQNQPPEIDNIFSKRIPSRHASEDIQYKEMHAVLVGLRTWLSSLGGSRVQLFCDNSAVVSGLIKSTIRGTAMSPLRTIVMLTAQADIILDVHWIPTEENTLADWLSRFQYNKIANAFPQLASMPRKSAP